MPKLRANLSTVKLLIALFALVGFFFIGPRLQSGGARVRASSYGPAASHTSAPGENNCTRCHTTNPLNTGGGSVTVSGIPLNYRPGQQIPITVTTAREGGVIFGFQVTALDGRNLQIGNFSLPSQSPAQMQIVNGIVGGNQRTYVEHTKQGVTPTQLDTKSWTFTWTAPSSRVGKVTFYAAGNAANSDGTNGGDYIYTTSSATLSGTSLSNFDGDLKTDISVYRPSTGVWYSLSSKDGSFKGSQWGTGTDKVVPGDYDGDGVTDFAVFRPSSGMWWIYKSTEGIYTAPFGANGDIPATGDYDGDLKSDIAVWRPSNGVWYVLRSSDGTVTSAQWGLSTDKIAQADYDGDGITDFAVWRPDNGYWYVIKSSDSGKIYQQFGLNGDRPVQGDYDGDGKTDFAVYRPSEGIWYLLKSTNGFSAIQWGISTDAPVPADYDGDGITDAAVYRGGGWYILKSTDGSMSAWSFGLADDVPLPGTFVAE